MCMRKLQLVWGNRDKAVIVLSCPKGDPNAFTPQESDVFKRYRMDPKNYKVCRPFALLAPSIVADARHAPLVSARCLQRGDAIKVGAWSSSLIMWQVPSLTADVAGAGGAPRQAQAQNFVANLLGLRTPADRNASVPVDSMWDTCIPAGRNAFLSTACLTPTGCGG